MKSITGWKEWAGVCVRVKGTICYHEDVKGFQQFEGEDKNLMAGIKKMFLLSE